MLKKLIIGAVALAVLAGAGGGGYFFLLADQEEEEVEVVPAPGFIKLDTLATPIMQDERIGSYVYIAVTLEIPDIADLDRVKRALPTLRDAYLRDLHRDPMPNDGAITSFDMGIFKARLLALTHEILGDETVSAVLITGTTVGAS